MRRADTGLQVIENVTGAVALSANEQLTDVVDVVTARHDRRLATPVGAVLTEPAGRHQPVAEARGPVGHPGGATLADVGPDRLRGAAIARRAVGREVGLTQVAQVTLSIAFGVDIGSEIVALTRATLKG